VPHFRVQRGRWIPAIAVFGALLASAASAQTPARLASRLNSDLDQLLQLLEGEFDNYWQARIDRESEVEFPHRRLHTLFTRVESAALGPHVFYVQQSEGGDAATISGQWLYHFRTDLEQQAIEMSVHAFADPAAMVDAHRQPAKLKSLSRADLTSQPGCEIYWQRREILFVGQTLDGACRIESERSTDPLVVTKDFRLTADGLWLEHHAVTVEGDYAYGHRGGLPQQLRRVRYFDCWSAVKPQQEDQEWEVWRRLVLHDQGGVVELKPADGRAARYSFELFQAVFAGEERVQVLQLAVHQVGQEESIAFSWSSPASTQLGVNLRFLQIGCTLRLGEAQALGISSQSSR